MKNRVALVVGATLLAWEAVWLFRRLQRQYSVRQVDFEAAPPSTEVDLNEASPEDLMQLGLNSETVNRLIENRPYRNKLELLSRIVLTEGVYDSIKEQISVSDTDEPVKVA
jgi:hypothetical protein